MSIASLGFGHRGIMHKEENQETKHIIFLHTFNYILVADFNYFFHLFRTFYIDMCIKFILTYLILVG